MSYINMRDFRINASEALRELHEDRQPRIVLRRGKPVAVLLPADDDASEAAALFRRAQAQLAIRAIRREAQQRGLDGMTPEQIGTIIRRSRRKGSA